MINFFRFDGEYKKNKKTILKGINKVLSSGQVFFGEEINKLEFNLNKFLNSKYGVTVKSGTDALYLALKCADIKVSDEVIVPAFTAIPTITSIVNVGAIPRLVDVNIEDGLIDVSKIERQINSKTKAIIPVHMYGLSCDMDPILKISKKYNLRVIEDCAQSFGATYKNKNTGTMGDYGCFSFYPTKVLGTYGDGGFVTTKSLKNITKLRSLRFYGIKPNSKKEIYESVIDGTNSRMDHIQASILNFK